MEHLFKNRCKLKFMKLKFKQFYLIIKKIYRLYKTVLLIIFKIKYYYLLYFFHLKIKMISRRITLKGHFNVTLEFCYNANKHCCNSFLLYTLAAGTQILEIVKK